MDRQFLPYSHTYACELMTLLDSHAQPVKRTDARNAELLDETGVDEPPGSRVHVTVQKHEPQATHWPPTAYAYVRVSPRPREALSKDGIKRDRTE
jgi:hypothetical protein